MTEDLKLSNAGIVNFKSKVMKVALKHMAIYNTKIGNDKLFTDPASHGHNCAIMTFQDIGT